MKKALNLFLAFFLFFLAGLVCGTCLYDIYLNVQHFVCGGEVFLLNKADLFKSFFFVAYCCVFFICPVVSYYRIRHPGGISQTIAYILICAVTWGVLFPLTYKLETFCEAKFSFTIERESLSSGYFRKVDDKVYYFTKDFKISGKSAGETLAVVIDTKGNGSVSVETVKDHESADFNRKAKPFREILVKDNFSEDMISLPIDLNVLIKSGKNCMQNGVFFFLSFLSIALIISSLYGLTNFFDWKLLNAILLFFGVMLILLVNTAYYLPVFDSIKQRLSSIKCFVLLSSIADQPILFVLNLLCMFLFIVMGIVKFAVHKHGKKE